MIDLHFIHWTPEIYFAVLSFFQCLIFLLLVRLSGLPISFQTVTHSLVGALLLSAIGYATSELELFSVIIFLVSAFAISLAVTKLNAFVSLAGTAALLVVVGLGSAFLCYPHSDLYREQVGGVTKFIYDIKYGKTGKEVQQLKGLAR